MKNCITHHYACDCREAVFETVLEALRSLRDAAKKEPAMNKMEYDTLGVQVNKAIAQGEAHL